MKGEEEEEEEKKKMKQKSCFKALPMHVERARLVVRLRSSIQRPPVCVGGRSEKDDKGSLADF